MSLLLCLAQASAGLAVLPDGRVLIADAVDNRVLILDPATRRLTAFPGTVVKVYGLQTGVLPRWPAAVVPDARGDLWVSCPGARVILKITRAGAVLPFAGSGATGHDDGPALQATFTHPAGMDTDNLGNLFVADGDRLRRVTPQEAVETVSTEFTNLVGGDLAVAAVGTVYVSEPASGKLWRVDGSTPVVVPGPWTEPRGLDLDADGTLYVADAKQGIYRRPTDGPPLLLSAPEKGWLQATAVSVDRGSSTVYVMDDADRLGRNRYRQFDRVARIHRIGADRKVELVINPGAPGFQEGPYDPELSGSPVPRIVGAILIALPAIGLAVFFWRHRKRLGS